MWLICSLIPRRAGFRTLLMVPLIVCQLPESGIRHVAGAPPPQPHSPPHPGVLSPTFHVCSPSLFLSSTQSVPNWIGTLAPEKSPARHRTSAIGQTCKPLAATGWRGELRWAVGGFCRLCFFFIFLYSLLSQWGGTVRSAPTFNSPIHL